jgi:hypothetical protein
MEDALVARSALQEHCSKLRGDLMRSIRDAADKTADRDAAIANLIEVMAKLEFLDRCNVPDGMCETWTNNDFRRACERLIGRLQAIVDSTPPDRF